MHEEGAKPVDDKGDTFKKDPRLRRPPPSPAAATAAWLPSSKRSDIQHFTPDKLMSIRSPSTSRPSRRATWRTPATRSTRCSRTASRSHPCSAPARASVSTGLDIVHSRARRSSRLRPERSRPGRLARRAAQARDRRGDPRRGPRGAPSPTRSKAMACSPKPIRAFTDKMKVAVPPGNTWISAPPAPRRRTHRSQCCDALHSVRRRHARVQSVSPYRSRTTAQLYAVTSTDCQGPAHRVSSPSTCSPVWRAACLAPSTRTPKRAARPRHRRWALLGPSWSLPSEQPRSRVGAEHRADELFRGADPVPGLASTWRATIDSDPDVLHEAREGPACAASTGANEPPLGEALSSVNGALCLPARVPLDGAPCNIPLCKVQKLARRTTSRSPSGEASGTRIRTGVRLQRWFVWEMPAIAARRREVRVLLIRTNPILCSPTKPGISSSFVSRFSARSCFRTIDMR